MTGTEINEETSPLQHRQEVIEKYWAGDYSRKAYLLRRQRKHVLESCRRIAVVGASVEPESESFVSTEKLLGLALEVVPVFPHRESFLGLRCYRRLIDIPGQIDIVQVFPAGDVDMKGLAREAVDKHVTALWIEGGMAASAEVEEILANGKVQLVEYENLQTEYLKHVPVPGLVPTPRHKDRKAVKVKERMTKNVETVKPDDGLKDAIWKMEQGHFRHLPVVDEAGKLIGMLTDRDIRLIRPSLAFINKEDAMVQIWTLTVQQAAVFDPVKVKPDTTLKEAAAMMLRWHVGGLPVVDDKDRLVGVLTYTDLLREFVGLEE